jgi:hypothetical protein
MMVDDGRLIKVLEVSWSGLGFARNLLDRLRRYGDSMTVLFLR